VQKHKGDSVMIKLSNERIQQIWDHELISAWDERGRTKMWEVINNFVNRVHPKGREGASFQDLIDYLVHLNLKRCLDVDHRIDDYTFKAWQQDVIGFIAARSKGLSDELMSGTPKPLILISIDDYKFKRLNVTRGIKEATKIRRAIVKSKAEKTVFARSLGNTSAWGAVK